MLSWKFDFAVHQQKYDDFILLILKYLHQKVFLLFHYFIMITTVIIKSFFAFPYLHKKNTKWDLQYRTCCTGETNTDTG